MLPDFFRQVIGQPDPCLPVVCRVQQYEADQQVFPVFFEVFRRKVFGLRRAAFGNLRPEIRKAAVFDVIIVVLECADEIPDPVLFRITADFLQIVDSLYIEKLQI